MIEIITKGASTKVLINGTDISNHITEMNLHWSPTEFPTIELFAIDPELISTIAEKADIQIHKVER